MKLQYCVTICELLASNAETLINIENLTDREIELFSKKRKGVSKKDINALFDKQQKIIGFRESYMHLISKAEALIQAIIRDNPTALISPITNNFSLVKFIVQSLVELTEAVKSEKLILVPLGIQAGQTFLKEFEEYVNNLSNKKQSLPSQASDSNYSPKMYKPHDGSSDAKTQNNQQPSLHQPIQNSHN